MEFKKITYDDLDTIKKYTLKADNKSFKDISITDEDDFYIIGKVLS